MIKNITEYDIYCLNIRSGIVEDSKFGYLVIKVFFKKALKSVTYVFLNFN